jgi:hypothetical protein
MALSTKAVVSTSGCKYLIKPLVALLPIPVTGAGAAPETSFKIAIKQLAPCLSGRRGGGQLSLRVIRQALPREEQLWQALADVEPSAHGRSGDRLHLGSRASTELFRLMEHRLGSVVSMKPGSGTHLIVLT